jgi:mitochondrial fission 1 protein
MKDYQTAKKYVHAFLEIEPSNQQILVIDVSQQFYSNLATYLNFSSLFFLYIF